MAAKPWHKLKVSEMGRAVTELTRQMWSDQRWRRNQYIRNLELFEGRVLGGYGAYAYDSGGSIDDFEPDQLGIVRSACQTAVANIYGQQKPKPQFQTLGATWATRRRAKRLDKICEGVLNQRQGRWINVWAFMLREAGMECVVQGVAPIKVSVDEVRKRVVHRVVPCIDLLVDPAEGQAPKNLFERDRMSESEALETWPKHSDAILGAPEYDWEGSPVQMRAKVDRVIEIYHGWRLPYGPGNPGIHCTVVGGAVVDHGYFEVPHFPFVFLGWEPHRDGYWFTGLAEQMCRQAADASDIHRRLLYRFRVASKKRTYYPRDTIKKEDLELNEAEVNIAYDGQVPPTDVQIPPFSTMEPAYRDILIRDTWDAGGISQVSAAARREQGIDSGIALITLNDTKSGRQIVMAKAYEQAFVDLAHQYVWALRTIATDDPEFAVQYPGKKLLQQIKWADADVEDDMFTVTVAEASALPHDPAGRQKFVQEMHEAKLISPETAKQLIGWPDLESELSVDNSEGEYVDMLIEKYLDADPGTWSEFDYQAPEGFLQNKPNAIRRFAAAWFNARCDQSYLTHDEQIKVEFNLGLLSRYIKELDKLMQDAILAQLAAEQSSAPAYQPIEQPPVV